MITERYGEQVHVIGGGLAGSEAVWQLVKAGVPAILHEMRPTCKTEVHATDMLAELVCSNSLRSDDPYYNAVGLLHQEMRLSDSLIMKAADQAKIPAGGALAVDRNDFSSFVTETLETQKLLKIRREEISVLSPPDWKSIVIATGPLTSPTLAKSIRSATNENSLAFFDAIAPIIYKDSINFNVAWFQSRYDKGDGKDYINLPMQKEEYDKFIFELISAEKTEFKEWEKNTPYFEGCLPIEIMADRGHKTLAYGPMKPVGLTNPKDPDKKPYAVVQLRQDNKSGTLFNMVGFQTKLKFHEQKRIFKMIPGLEAAKFARLGGLHRNTFLNSPQLLDATLRLKTIPRIRFAGQITGCEGYVESAAIGLIAGRFAAAEILGIPISLPPITTALGALLNYITGGAITTNYQPMNINFGLLPPLKNKSCHLKGRERKKALSERALSDLCKWLKSSGLTCTSS
ncbi:MAG: Methylenetetrahydrofolate--tRNA-(uracil-5-)-methyltransferase TrmFO [Alphaproteobacteria bacterium MarineAlpha3_Bin5]|nr:MAG: Methylenetetrahydrofolate--tRNA-(uracil-5-)-methyltransferase TrmFO [Alphaproteobacteria bacterium MarineAlpha3_Bin5]